MLTANKLRSRLERLEAALLPRPKPPELHFLYRVHTTQRLEHLLVSECADAREGATLVLDYIAVRQGDQWKLSGEARRRPPTEPDDKGNIVTGEGMRVGEVVRDRGDGVIELIANADETEWGLRRVRR